MSDVQIISDFHYTCRHAMGDAWKDIRRRIFISLTASPFIIAAYTATAPTEPYSIGGYTEIQATPSDQDTVVQFQAKYLKEKIILQAAFDDCAAHPNTCDPNVKSFSDMLALVQKVPDKLTQIGLINAYVNTFYYDQAEYRLIIKTGTALFDRPMKSTIDTKLFTCLGASEVKLFALEQLHYREDDLRIVIEDEYMNGQYVAAHAITTVRVDNLIWAMNLTTDPVEKRNSMGQRAESAIIKGSIIETAAAELNFSNHSRWITDYYFDFEGTGIILPEDNVYVPVSEFNSIEASNFYSAPPKQDLSNVPAAARAAPKNWQAVSLDTLEKYNLVQPLMEAVAESYKMNSAELTGAPAPARDSVEIHTKLMNTNNQLMSKISFPLHTLNK